MFDVVSFGGMYAVCVPGMGQPRIGDWEDWMDLAVWWLVIIYLRSCERCIVQGSNGAVKWEMSIHEE
jgi:hypothetical protein